MGLNSRVSSRAPGCGSYLGQCGGRGAQRAVSVWQSVGRKAEGEELGLEEQAGTASRRVLEAPSRCKRGSPRSDVATDTTFLKSFFFFFKCSVTLLRMVVVESDIPRDLQAWACS